MVCMCLKCCALFRFTSSNIISYSSSDHYTVNVGAVLGQIATGGGAIIGPRVNSLAVNRYGIKSLPGGPSYLGKPLLMVFT